MMSSYCIHYACTSDKHVDINEKVHAIILCVSIVHIICSSEIISDSFSVHFLFIFCSFSVHFLFIFCSFSVHFLFIFCSFSVHFLFIFCSFSVHFLFIFCSVWVQFGFSLGSAAVQSAHMVCDLVHHS